MDTLSTAQDLERAGFERVKAEAIATAIWRYHERAATKSDLEPLATRADLEPFATRADLEPFATKADLEPLATRAELSRLEERMATRADLEPFATRADLEALALGTKAALSELETRITNRFYGVALGLAGVTIASIKLL